MFSSIVFLAYLLAFTIALPTSEGIRSNVEKRAVSSAVYSTLTWYFQYASSSYSSTCAKPNGNTLVTTLNDVATDTQGFIARDDTKKEIVVALRGSTSATDFLTDADIALVSYTSPGVSSPSGTMAHLGFLTAYNSVASTIISTVKAQLAAHPGYGLVSTGHSLGGALSSLAGVSLKANFPSSTVYMYTYGQPRTGNPAYAAYVDSLFGTTNVFRSVNYIDGVPTIIPTYDGYRHHGVEYWAYTAIASASTIKVCSGDEDLTCSDSIPSEGIDAAHLTYYGIFASTTFCT